jgi:hypothetical protein
MPRPIDLDPKLLAQVVAPSPRPPAAPPAPQVTGGVKGNLPMGVGTALRRIERARLTPEELRLVESLGLKEGDIIPPNMAQIVDKAHQAQLQRVQNEQMMVADEVRLPVPPGTPPTPWAVRDIDDLDPAAKAQVMREIGDSVQAYKDLRGSQRPGSPVSNLDPAAAQAARLAQRLGGRATGEDFARVVNDLKSAPQIGERPGPQPQKSAPPPPQQQSAEPPAPPPAAETGADAANKTCPHCRWPQDVPDVPNPDYADKIAFLHSVLGQKTFTKEYKLFNGALMVQFRTLSVGEIDTIWRQMALDSKNGRFDSDLDFREMISRYRMFLQLQKLYTPRQGEPGSIFHDMPDGLSVETNSEATAVWNAGTIVLSPGATLLPYVEKHMTTRVLVNEGIFKIVLQACGQFNRLAAKLEALADNADFWKETDGHA